MTAASTAASNLQPVVVNLIGPAAGVLQYTQVVGTLLIALIAAAIAGGIQYRQMLIARAAMMTAANKLTLDLFDRRIAMYDAAEKLISDNYTFEGNSWDDLGELAQKLHGARWLLNEDAALVLGGFVRDARNRLRRPTFDRTGMSGKEISEAHVEVMRDQFDRMEKEVAQLRALFDPFLSIRH